MGSLALTESAGLRIRSLVDHLATGSSDSRISNEKGSRPITSTWRRATNTGFPVATRMGRTPSYSTTAEIDDDVRREYWTKIRNQPENNHISRLKVKVRY